MTELQKLVRQRVREHGVSSTDALALMIVQSVGADPIEIFDIMIAMCEHAALLESAKSVREIKAEFAAILHQHLLDTCAAKPVG